MLLRSLMRMGTLLPICMLLPGTCCYQVWEYARCYQVCEYTCCYQVWEYARCYQVNICNNYAHYFGIVIFILYDTVISCSSRCFLLLLNAHYCCIITWVILSQKPQLRIGEVLACIQSLESCTVQGTSRCHPSFFFQMYTCPFLQAWGTRLIHSFSHVLNIQGKPYINILNTPNHCPTMSRMLLGNRITFCFPILANRDTI